MSTTRRRKRKKNKRPAKQPVQSVQQKQPPKQITPRQWMEIAQKLQEHHALFYQAWAMGRPFFTDEIPTAAVRFDHTGDFIRFEFNPEFWESRTLYERLFVISHECLHVIFNHGLRTRDAISKEVTNQLLDVVVNHTLKNNFDFDRSKIPDADKLCWVDTIFPDKKLPDDEAFEFYYNQVPKIEIQMVGDGDGEGGSSSGSGMGSGQLVDDHSDLPNLTDSNKIIEKLNQVLTPSEKQSLKDLINQHTEAPSPEQIAQGGKQAGNITGGIWTFADVQYVPKKKRWETVIKRWSQKFLKDGEVEQWLMTNRRWVMLDQDLLLPSEREDDGVDRGRIPVYFFLDTSGSCWDLKDRFFAAAMSLPKEHFKLRLFCFDTQVEETTLESRNIYGGGGTRFDIIEQKIQQLIRTEGVKYPEACFIITDGYGNHVKPMHADRWQWFLSEGHSTHCIPKESLKHDLEQFE